MDDQVYIQRVLEGELDAFAFLVEKYKDQALSVAVRIVKYSDLAEDILQEAFIGAFNGLNKFKGEASFKTWFFRIVYNESIQYLRHKQVEQKHEEGVKEFMYSGDTSTFDSLKLHDQQNIIEQTFEQMSSKEATVLQLYYLEELSIKEISEVMGIKNDNVKVILHRARKSFYHLISTTSENKLIALI